jgi:hypothetical protein
MGGGCGGTPELAAIWELLVAVGGRRWLLLVALIPSGGDGGTLGVAENARSAEVAAAAAHVGLPGVTGAVEAVWAAWCARVAQVARGAWAGSAGGPRGSIRWAFERLVPHLHRLIAVGVLCGPMEYR